MDTLAYSNWFRNSGIPGRYLPIRMPNAMQMMTQTVRYRWKKLIPVLLSLFIIVSSFTKSNIIDILCFKEAETGIAWIGFFCQLNLAFSSSIFCSIRRIVSRNASSLFPVGSSNPQSSRCEQGLSRVNHRRRNQERGCYTERQPRTCKPNRQQMDE